MNKNVELRAAEIGDTIALKLQTLRQEGKIDDEQPLLRIDYRKEAAQAPFQFDIKNAKLHRTMCTSIPQGAQRTLYAVWRLGAKDLELACEKCRPAPIEEEHMKKDVLSDVVFGLLSVVDQFGSVLTERGKEYRNSKRGQRVSKTVEVLSSGLDQKQREALNVTISSLEDLLKIIHGYDERLQQKSKNKRGRNGRSTGSNGRRNRRKRA